MKAKTSFSTKQDPAQVAAALRAELYDQDARLLVYFASASYDAVALAREIAAAFPGVTTFGCTTAGEITSGQMMDKSVVAMALGSQLVRRVVAAPAEGISADPRGACRATLQSLEKQLGAKLNNLDCDKFCGLVLVDGLTGTEETVMDELGNASNLTFIGGSAGDDLQFKKTHLFINGRAYTNVAALAVLEMAVPFRVLKTQSFRVLPKVLVATKVNEKSREVIEFNHQPAAQAYADALGVPVASLPEKFMNHPLGLIADNEPYVRSPQAVAGSAVKFYCQILEGMDMHVLESTDIVADTDKAVRELGQPSALINFHCILRTLELKNKGQCPAYGKLFENVPTVGFSTYGEAYIGHINQTSTMLVLG